MIATLRLILSLDRWQHAEVINSPYERIQIMTGGGRDLVHIGWATVKQTQGRLQVTAGIFKDVTVHDLTICGYVLTGRRLYITSFQSR